MIEKKLVGLSKASHQKKQAALLKTEQAIAKLSNQKQKITIRSVAKEAGVSVSYIYKYPELAYKIQQLREQQKYSQFKSDHSTSNAEQKLQKLQQEKAKLVQEVWELKAIIDSKTIGGNSLTDLENENIRLITENRRLNKELKYTQRNLQEAREFILRGDWEKQNEIEAKVDTKEIHQFFESEY
ncbi:MAG: DUF6262 family protein [Cyanobacteria bacterium P01_A01_bin.40]